MMVGWQWKAICNEACYSHELDSSFGRIWTWDLIFLNRVHWPLGHQATSWLFRNIFFVIFCTKTYLVGIQYNCLVQKKKKKKNPTKEFQQVPTRYVLVQNYPSLSPELSHCLKPCRKKKCLFVCLCWGFTAQSTQWGHVEHCQFTKPHVYWAGLVL